MNILLAFAPFFAFAVVSHLAGISAGLAAGAVSALLLVVRDALAGRRAKWLEIGTTVLFGALALYALRMQPAWSLAQVRLLVDCGLLAIVLGSMLARMPFTLQYAYESVAPEFWQRPEFIRKNYVITGVWAAAFAAMVLADLVMQTRQGAGVLMTVLAITCAVKFTQRYAGRVSAAN